jgi:peptidoglycan/LPS O-acetylase OafA/YrhL
VSSRALAHSPESPRDTERSFYRPELDVLRFFAFFSVFIAHLGRAPKFVGVPGVKGKLLHLTALVFESGGFGVCIFFLLSAYLITELLIRERTCTGSIHLRAFYTRRILRIWPLYFGTVFAGYLFGLWVPSYRLSWKWMVTFVFLAANWYTGRVGYAPTSVVVLWSISIEEQFYLLWPSVAKFGGIRALKVCAILTIPIGYGVLFYLCGKGVPMQPPFWTNSFVHFSFFGIGALIALALHKRAPFLIPIPARLLLFGGGVLLWLVANHSFHVQGVFFQPRPWMVSCGFGLAAIGCISIFFSLFGISPALLPRQLIYLGKISYGLYVFHAPCREVAGWMLSGITHGQWFRPLLEVALTLPVAALSYRYFEKPFLRLKARFEFIKTR